MGGEEARDDRKMQPGLIACRHIRDVRRAVDTVGFNRRGDGGKFEGGALDQHKDTATSGGLIGTFKLIGKFTNSCGDGLSRGDRCVRTMHMLGKPVLVSEDIDEHAGHRARDLRCRQAPDRSLISGFRH